MAIAFSFEDLNSVDLRVQIGDLGRTIGTDSSIKVNLVTINYGRDEVGYMDCPVRLSDKEVTFRIDNKVSNFVATEMQPILGEKLSVPRTISYSAILTLAMFG